MYKMKTPNETFDFLIKYILINDKLYKIKEELKLRPFDFLLSDSTAHNILSFCKHFNQ